MKSLEKSDKVEESPEKSEESIGIEDFIFEDDIKEGEIEEKSEESIEKSDKVEESPEKSGEIKEIQKSQEKVQKIPEKVEKIKEAPRSQEIEKKIRKYRYECECGAIFEDDTRYYFCPFCGGGFE